MSDLTLLPSNAVEVAGARTFTTSMMVAEVFGKRHDNVLQSIDELECSQEFRLLNFQESFRETATGQGAIRKFRAFEITKDGFTFLVMGYTGAKAAQFKEAYIKRFNEMEAQLQGPHALLSRQRWLAHVDQAGHLVFNPVAPDAFVLPPEDWPSVIKTTDFPRNLLPELVAAVGERMKALGGLTAANQRHGDWQAVVQAIFSAQIPVYGERFTGDLSAANLIGVVASGLKSQDGVKPSEAKRALGLCGLRVDGDLLLVSNTHQAIANILQEKQIDCRWSKALLSAPGAVKYPKPVKIQGVTTRVVGVPIDDS